MTTATSRLLTLVALLLAVAWFARSPDWEPAITVVAFLAALIGQEVSRARSSEQDKALFERFLAEFPSDGRSMRFLREHDIGGPFQSSALEDVNNFIHTWDDAEHEFQHKELEARRKALLKSAQNFREEIATHTFPSNVSGYLTMDLRDYEDRPEKLAIRKHLNDLATDLYNQHQEFVRFGRRTV